MRRFGAGETYILCWLMYVNIDRSVTVDYRMETANAFGAHPELAVLCEMMRNV